MATLAAMRTEVSRIIQDSDYTATTIDRMINESVTSICAGVMITWPEGDQTISQPMPDLFTIGDVATTSNAYASLPSDYQRDVVFIAGPEGNEITFYDAFGDFVRNYPLLNTSGSVVAVAVKGSNLYYQGIPDTAETLKVHYYAAPTEMSDDTDEPEGIPSRFHMTLIVYDVCLRIFKEFYEEDAGEHPVLAIYESKRMTELINMDSLIGSDQGSVIFKSR